MRRRDEDHAFDERQRLELDREAQDLARLVGELHVLERRAEADDDVVAVARRVGALERERVLLGHGRVLVAVVDGDGPDGDGDADDDDDDGDDDNDDDNDDDS